MASTEVLIIDACESGQALEADEVRRGPLTYVLVKEGLEEGRADIAPPDGQILLSEWLRFSEARVPELAQQLIGKRNRGFDHLQMESVQRSAVQKPRVFFRPELEDERWFVIAKTRRSVSSNESIPVH